MPRPSQKAALVILPLIMLLLGWQLGVRFEQRSVGEFQKQFELVSQGGIGSGAAISDPASEIDLTLLWGVWKLLLKHYIDPVALEPRSMFFGAVRGLVAAVGDPYTTFMTPEENEDFRESLDGELQGIGAELTVRDGQVIIVSPLKGSPAERAGLQPEDIVVEVDGASVVGQSLSEVVQKIRGPKGTKVTIGVLREDEAKILSFTITREEIKVPSVSFEVKETESGSVAYLEVNQFGDDTIEEVAEVLRGLREDEVSGLVLDLRFNGGGYLDGAVDMTSLFLEKGKVVSVQRRTGEPQHHYVSGRPLLTSLPLVILINEASASASEIVAGALQDHERAKVIGKKSFGKGTVQEVMDLPGGSSLRVTVAKWLTPSGKDLSADGVHPDIEVEFEEEDRGAGRDPQLEAALAAIFR